MFLELTLSHRQPHLFSSHTLERKGKAEHTMILDQIAWLDCAAFLLFLAPQLLIHVGLFQTAICAIKALPFLRKQRYIYMLPA